MSSQDWKINMIPENRLFIIIQAFGEFQGKSLATLEAANSLSKEDFQTIEASIVKLASALESLGHKRKEKDLSEEFLKLATKIKERLPK